jgi:hypothetical protein
LSAQKKNAKPDRDLVARMTQAILGLFPSCRHRGAYRDTRKRSGGTHFCAGRALEAEALIAVAAIRHNHTRYDQRLMRGWNRNDGRDTVREVIERIMELTI